MIFGFMDARRIRSIDLRERISLSRRRKREFKTKQFARRRNTVGLVDPRIELCCSQSKNGRDSFSGRLCTARTLAAKPLQRRVNRNAPVVWEFACIAAKIRDFEERNFLKKIRFPLSLNSIIPRKVFGNVYRKPGQTDARFGNHSLLY